MKMLALFDPALRTNEGDHSINLGDLIIHESVERYLKEIFPTYELFRISSHIEPPLDLLKKARKAACIVFGGTNALSSDLKKYNQWKLGIPRRALWPIKFPIENVLLLGVGWWQYQNSPTAYTRSFYRKALSSKYLHSVRDQYTYEKLKGMGFENIVNTACPSMWELDGLDVSQRNTQTKNCLFTLTDYYQDPERDNEVVKRILEGYDGDIFFFPQGTLDVEYISTLSCYQQSAGRITTINRSFDDYVKTLRDKDVDYIGTRLHAGIKALQLGRSALILAVDNRAVEIAKDTGLPVVERNRLELLGEWISGHRLFDRIRLPIEAIKQWKEQFR